MGLSDEERAIDVDDWSEPQLVCPIWHTDGTVELVHLGPLMPRPEDPRVQNLRDACDL